MQVETPLFIGSGEEAGKKEIVIDGRNDRFLIIDPVKLFRAAKERGLQDQLENYYLRSQDDLGKWLRDNGFSTEEREHLISYSIKKGERSFSWESQTKGKKPKPVNLHLFIKDSFHQPYIPGSSIKGAIRTSILGALVLKDLEGKRQVERFNSADRLEKFFFEKNLYERQNKNENIKIFRGLKISDSRPVSNEQLIGLKQVSFKHLKAKGKPYAELPIYREYLLPGTQFEFQLSIDERFFRYSFEEIMSMIQLNNRFIEKKLRTNFIEEPIILKDYLKIGGGAGFISKTVAHQLYGTNYRLIRSRLSGKERGKSTFFPSQLRGVRYEGKVLEAGIASLHKQVLIEG